MVELYIVVFFNMRIVNYFFFQLQVTKPSKVSNGSSQTVSSGLDEESETRPTQLQSIFAQVRYLS
jgi:hypothetical protein